MRSVVLGFLSMLIGLAAVAVLPAAPAIAGVTGASFACTPNTVYSLLGTGIHDITRLNATSGAKSANGAIDHVPSAEDLNAMALPAGGGSFAYAFNRDTNQVVRYNVTTGVINEYNAPAAGNAEAINVLAGGINPVNGYFYYAAANSTTWKIYAFNPATNQAIGQVAQITGMSNNGDLAFDSAGNVYLTTNSGNDAAGQFRRVTGPLPTTAGTTSFSSTLLASLPANEGTYVGAAFDKTSAGATVLVIGTSDGTLLTVNPSTGAQISKVATGITFNDLASCNAPAPVQLPDFSCAPDTVYAIDNAQPHTLVKVTPSTGTVTSNGTVRPDSTNLINALALPASGGRYAYAFDRTANDVLRFDTNNGDTTSYDPPANADAGSVVAGAINPANGVYYYASGGSTSWKVFAFNTNTNTALGQVAVINGLSLNGDFAFDGNGNLYVASNADATAAGALYRVNGMLPTAAGTITAFGVTKLADLPASSGQYASAAFEDSGLLIVGTSTGKLLSINPSSGSLVSTKQTDATFSDMASCATPSTAKSQVNLPAGRVNAGDQFTTTITGGGLSAGNAGTTAGTDTGLQGTAAETAGPVLLLAGTEYTATQSAASGANLANYTTTYKCTNDANGNALSQGSGNVAKFTAPATGNVTCIFTNTPTQPAITIDQTVSAINDLDGNGPDAGDTVSYGYVVKNTGDTVLNNVAVTDAKLGAVTCPKTTLAAGETMTCTAKTYALTQGDVDAGKVDNSATVKGTSPAGTQVQATDPTTVTVPATPLVDIDLIASAINDLDNNGPDAGDTITYGYKVTNTGNVKLTGLATTETTFTNGAAVVCPKTELLPGESMVCTSKTYTIKQDDVNAGKVDNTATVTGKSPAGATVTDSDKETTSIAQTPRIDIDLVASAIVDGDNNGPDAGDKVTYSYTITNTGNVPLTNVGASDTRVGALTCSPTTLAPGAKATCTSREYTLTQGDVDAGLVTNKATTTGKFGNVTVTDDDTENTTVPRNPAVVIDQVASAIKDGDNNGPDAGDVITYTHTVTNTGNVTLTDVVVTDAKTGAVVCTVPAGGLAPGASITCTPKDYVLKQSDVDAGKVDNSATVTAKGPQGTTPPSGSDTVSTPVPASPAILLDQNVGNLNDNDNNGPDVGDTLTYTHTVKNTGNVTLKDIKVVDTKLGTITCGTGPIAPGETLTCTNFVYTLTQADINAGKVVTSATATGTAPDNATKVTSTDGNTVAITGTPAVKIDQTASAVNDKDGNGTDPGDEITYNHVITNTGNVTLTNVAVTDTKLGTITCGTAPVSLAPGQSVTCTPVVYTLVQGDIDLGYVDTAATVTGRSPSNVTVRDTDTTRVTLNANGSIDIDLTATAIKDVDGNGPDAGDTVTYSYLITNNGGVTLTNVTASDTKTGTLVCLKTTLAPGETTTCTSKVYELTQADVDAGFFNNVATARGRTPANVQVTSTDTVRTTVPAAGSVRLDLKAGPIVDNDNNGVDPGDTITYDYVITNTGNVTLTNPVVTDDKFGTITCPTGPIEPGKSVTCTSKTYVLTQADINAGKVENSGVVTATTPAGATVTDPDAAFTTVPSTPAIDIKLTAGPIVDNDNNGVDPGDTITYNYKVTNAGNVPLNPVTVKDTRFGDITCPAGPLAPGASVDCTAKTYVLTQADINAGKVDNTATTTGTAPNGVKVTDTDAKSTPVPANPAIDLVAQAGPVVDKDNNGVDPGDTITYTYTVKNTGNVPLDTVKVTDITGPVSCQATTLNPGATTTCTSTYVITQDDINAGKVDNPASVTGTAPNGVKPTDSETTTVPVNGTPAILLELTAGPIVDGDNNGPDAGDTITYSYKVTNTGNVPLTNVSVTDDKFGAIVCPKAALAVGESMNCTARTYTLTQQDINAGFVANAGAATGKAPNGATVADPDSVYTPVAAYPAVEIDLVAGPLQDVDNNGPDAGDTITYSYTVKNTGNVALDPITVTDTFGAVVCGTGPLAPGATRTCTSKTVTLKQEDIDAGKVDNTATVTGKAPNNVTVSDSDTETTELVVTPKVELDKTAGSINDVNGNGPDAGDTITYSFKVTNKGGVSVSQITVTDPKTGPVTCPTTALAPGASVDCTPRTYTLTQDDVNEGKVVNTATVTVTSPEGKQATATDTVTVPVNGKKSIKLDAVAGPINDNDQNGPDAGDTITYTYTVTNDGVVPLTGVAISDPKVGAVTCPKTTLAVGESMICTAAPYTITPADVAAGKVDTNPTVTAKAPQGETVTDQDTTTTPVKPENASIAVEVTPGPVVDKDGNGPDAGDTIDYTIVVTNDGNVPLTGITVTDPKLGPITCPKTELAVGESMTCTKVTYTITPADVAAGKVETETTASGQTPAGQTVTDTDTTSTPVTPVTPKGKLEVDVTPGPISDNDNNGPDAGDTIDYTIVVRNTGNAPVSGITVTDPKLGPITCPKTELAPNESMTCTVVTYTITPGDVAAGKVDTNTTATGKNPDGTTVTGNDTTSTPVVQQKANVKVTMTADDTTPQVGDVVTYTLVVKNDGPAAADNVVLKDVLPGGLTYVSSDAPCVASGNNVTCDFGTLAPGASRTVTIKAKVDPLTADNANHQHLIDVQKAEAHIDLEPGQTRTVAVGCLPGYLVTDGSGRIDAVDQGTGTLGSVRILESKADGTTGWTVTMVNDASGRAQGKVFAVCVKSETETVNNHSHQVESGAPVSQTVALPNGISETTLTCAAGTTPMTPGYSLTGNARVLTSYPSGSNGWTFRTDTTGTGTATFTIGCLNTKVSPANGHQHDLVLNDVKQTVTVPAGQTVEVQLTCADDAKGIVGGYDLDKGLINLGNDPRPIIRVFKLFNPTNGPLDADLYLKCLSVRTKAGNGSSNGGKITNTATVTTTTVESNYADNSDSVTITVTPATMPGATVSVSRTTASAPVTCGTGGPSCTGTATLVALNTTKVNGKTIKKGTVLARTTYKIAAGKKVVLKLKSTDAGKRVFAAQGVKKAQLKVGGTTKVVSLRR